MNETKQKLVIQEIRIWKKSRYEEPNPDRFVAQIRMESLRGNLEVAMAPEAAEKLMEFVAPLLVEFSKASVAQIAQDISDQVQALRNPVIEQIAEKTEAV